MAAGKKSKATLKRLIGLYFEHFDAITPEEYEELKRVLTARALCGDVTIVEHIAYNVMKGNAHRYYEIKRLEELENQDQKN